MCITVHHTEILKKKAYFFKVVAMLKQNHFHSFVHPTKRQIQIGSPSKGGTLDYRIGEVTNPPADSPGIYVFTTFDKAKRNAQYQKRWTTGTKVAVIKVMASTGSVVHSQDNDNVGMIQGPVLVVSRERISR